MPSLVLLKPFFGEKATNLAAISTYTFEVMRKANKAQIKTAVEAQFGVKVGKVRTANFKSEIKKQGRYFGKTRGFKKAIVTLEDGSIDLWAPPDSAKATSGKPEKTKKEK